MDAAQRDQAAREVEWQRAGLLPDEPSAAEKRRHLLRWLHEQGITLEEMVRADKAGRLYAVVGDRTVRGLGRRLTAAERADVMGLSEEVFRQIWRTLGFPAAGTDQELLSETEAQSFSVAALALDLLGLERGTRLAFTISQSMRAIAEAVNVAFIDNDDTSCWVGRATSWPPHRWTRSSTPWSRTSIAGSLYSMRSTTTRRTVTSSSGTTSAIT